MNAVAALSAFPAGREPARAGRRRQRPARGPDRRHPGQGPNVFRGYWRMPEKTEEEFTKDGYFKTGDVGKVDERGYVHIVGRSKDLIISGGWQRHPAEIGGYINEMPGVAESALVGVPHPTLAKWAWPWSLPSRRPTGCRRHRGPSSRSQLGQLKIPRSALWWRRLPPRWIRCRRICCGISTRTCLLEV